MKKTIYADEENKTLFFNPKEYLQKFIKPILTNIRQGRFYAQGKVSIHIPYSSEEELFELIKDNPEKKAFYRIQFLIQNETATFWKLNLRDVRKKIISHCGGDFDRIFVDKFKLIKELENE